MRRQASAAHYPRSTGRLALAACLFLAGSASAAGQEAASGYAIKPSDVAVPSGVALGNYRRVIQPFQNWTLICDEDLQNKRRICNISQTLVDSGGATVFSWSLAANAQGKPFMILRAPLSLGPEGAVQLTLPGRKEPVEVKMQGCQGTVCLGYLPVGPLLREQIGKKAIVQISYSQPSGGQLSLSAPLDGLSKALSAIK